MSTLLACGQELGDLALRVPAATRLRRDFPHGRGRFLAVGKINAKRSEDAVVSTAAKYEQFSTTLAGVFVALRPEFAICINHWWASRGGNTNRLHTAFWPNTRKSRDASCDHICRKMGMRKPEAHELSAWFAGGRPSLIRSFRRQHR